VIGLQLSYIKNIREGSSVFKFFDGGTFSASELTCVMMCVATNRGHHHHQVARPAVSIAVSTTERHLERSCARSLSSFRGR